jgi:hypothetical protein
MEAREFIHNMAAYLAHHHDNWVYKHFAAEDVELAQTCYWHEESQSMIYKKFCDMFFRCSLFFFYIYLCRSLFISILAPLSLLIDLGTAPYPPLSLYLSLILLLVVFVVIRGFYLAWCWRWQADVVLFFCTVLYFVVNINKRERERTRGLYHHQLTPSANGIAKSQLTLILVFSIFLSRTLLNERCRRNELDNNKLTKKVVAKIATIGSLSS